MSTTRYTPQLPTIQNNPTNTSSPYQKSLYGHFTALQRGSVKGENKKKPEYISTRALSKYQLLKLHKIFFIQLLE